VAWANASFAHHIPNAHGFTRGSCFGAAAMGSARSYPAEIAVPGSSWRVPAGAARPDLIGGHTPAGNRRRSLWQSANPAISLGPISTRRDRGRRARNRPKYPAGAIAEEPGALVRRATNWIQIPFTGQPSC